MLGTGPIESDLVFWELPVAPARPPRPSLVARLSFWQKFAYACHRQIPIRSEAWFGKMRDSRPVQSVRLLEWPKANFGRAGPGPRWDLAWRSANLGKFRLRRSFARGPAPSTPVLEESLDFEAGREKKEGFLNLISSGPMWSNVGPMLVLCGLSHAIQNGPMCLKM